MELVFDISTDELPIFFAEAEEQFQVLDEALMRMEKQDTDPELLQSAFRAAHTLKGTAGMIGHDRMVTLTHAMETAFDAVRKGQLEISTTLTDLSLETIDALREVCQEVSTHVPSAVDIEGLRSRFNSLSAQPATPQQAPSSMEALLAEIERAKAERAAADDAVAEAAATAEPAAPSAQVTAPGTKSAAPNNGSRSNSKPERQDATVRTSIERLDAMMNLVGELIIDRNHLYQIRSRIRTENLSNTSLESLMETVSHLGLITDQLQEEVLRIRMLPVSNVFHKFPRMVRDLAQKTSKQVNLILQGEETEMDRSVIEEINDPLIHLLRNAIDHGIEPPDERVQAGKAPTGTIRLTAHHEQGRIIITIEDDGRGINRERLKEKAVQRRLITEDEAAAMNDDAALELMFLSGVSTAANVTDISGRGVGMDIVRHNLQRINGKIIVQSRPYAGTTYTISLPLTLAIVPALLVRVANTIFAIPLVMISETLRLKTLEINTVFRNPVATLRNKALPLTDLGTVCQMQPCMENRNAYVVVVFTGSQPMGLVVDELIREEEVVLKSLGSWLGETPCVSSAAVLGDGSIALVLDVASLQRTAKIV